MLDFLSVPTPRNMTHKMKWIFYSPLPLKKSSCFAMGGAATLKNKNRKIKGDFVF